MPGYNYVNKSSLHERVRGAMLAKEGKAKKGLRAVNNEAVNEGNQSLTASEEKDLVQY